MMGTTGLRRRSGGSFVAVMGLVLAGVTSVVVTFGAAQTQPQLLSGRWDTTRLQQALLPARSWCPYPRATERTRWLALPQAVRQGHIRAGEAKVGADWPIPRATVFLEYVRTGNRSNYQDISFGRREQLAALVLAECMEGKGRFLPDIVDGVWTICEETYWGVPAHVGLQKRGPGLPDVTEPTVDLFAAETGALLAWTSYLLSDSLDSQSPLLRDRIHAEVRRRILAVNLERDDFWWMGFTETTNNWNPWICSNWLTAVLLLEDDPGLRGRAVHKILRCLDNFVNTYPDDGGCDEGPTYWTRAAASLFDCLELLQAATGGAFDVFAHPRIREMGRYIARAHIAGDYFINFADASAKASPDASVVFRYGRSTGDSLLTAFGAYLGRRQAVGSGPLPGRFGVLGRTLPALFSLQDLLRAPAREPLLRDFWLPGVQVMGARSVNGSPAGLYLAAQGGHNAESHNHNDVGNFIVYADGEPVIIDVGVETYTARTFSADRYSIWTMQSAFHNLPTINGTLQAAGRAYSASAVVYTENDSAATLSLDIHTAYPPSAGVRSWRRTISLARGDAVTVHDRFSLDTVREGVSLNLMTARKAVIVSEGRIDLTGYGTSGSAKPVHLLYDPSLFSPLVETIRLDDAQLRSSWGDSIERIVLTMRRTPAVGECVLVFRQ